MWNFASSCMAGSIGPKNNILKPTQDLTDCSDDEVSSMISREEGLECPICWESFNLVENIPYVLWCGHTLCKNCILGLQWAVVKFPTLTLQLPLFISCPWCSLLSLRLVYRGNLKFPRKNFFLLWMLESMNGDRVKSHSTACGDHHQAVWPRSTKTTVSHTSNHHPSAPRQEITQFNSYHAIERFHLSLKKSLVFFVHLTAKFPLVIIFLLIVFYAIPASAAILALYILITVVFAIPSFLILYFAYPSLDWLVREIIT
ncbi:Non-specific serine/threonine protein kinase [Handroanthus impetiginosus]|uniref:Non-specific serine/threonine protein kinase n=1 Tax=Handroanthus impetiginosus TaxID=429701 RepID=A0A2G9G3R6_9LAMI|nr:Non-specific serine/threonine protein kinase [Handroanthus impetiginosus]